MPFCKFIVNSVGDANCIFIQDFYETLMLDCGINNKTDYKENENIQKQILSAKNLLISHYHSDHFNILTYIENGKLNISNVYYPYLPEIELKETLLKQILFISYLTLQISIKKAYDLISLLKQINKEKSFNYEPLYKGKKLFDHDPIDVIWPPKSLPENVQNSFNRKIKEIDDYIKKIPEISDLWSRFDRFSFDTETQFGKKDWNDSAGIIYNSTIDFEKYKENISEIDDKIKAITNSLSICLFKENDFLFLGDLEKNEVTECLKQLKSKLYTDKINVKYFITPHHGTKNHYSQAVSIVNADYVISSNGSKRFKDYDERYNDIGKYHHCTFENGTFERNNSPCLFSVNLDRLIK